MGVKKMKIAVVGHSLIALRQQLFFKEVAKQGHEVLCISPGEWGNLRAQNYIKDFPDSYLSFRTCKHMMGDDVYNYHLMGAKDLVDEFKPDWLYVQAEPKSSLAQEAIMWDVDKRALFTWENIGFESSATGVLPKYDLVICGNPESEELVRPWNPHTSLMLQVGVDPNHFKARPEVHRDIRVGYIGRATSEKGLPYLSRAWPTVSVADWVDFLELPWVYSRVQVVVSYSQDVPWWREQAPNYVVLESLLCGCKAVISDTNAMDYWMEGCPCHIVVLGHDQPDDTLRMERVDQLRVGIQAALDMEIKGEAREWVIERFSNVVMARKLLEVLEGD